MCIRDSQNATFVDACLQGASLEYAQLDGSNLSKLRGAKANFDNASRKRPGFRGQI